MSWVATVPEEEIPLGSCKEVLAGEESILLVRQGERLFACSAYCPHKAMNLESGDLDGYKLTCPLHAATFDLETGVPEEETDWAGKLAVYPVEVRKGVIHVKMP